MQMGTTSSVTRLTNVRFQLIRQTPAGWRSDGGNLTVCYPIFGKVAGVIPQTPVQHGRSQAFWNPAFSGATQLRARMRWAPSSTLAFFRHFVKICTGQPTVVSPGQSCSPTDSPAEAINSGSPSTRQTG